LRKNLTPIVFLLLIFAGRAAHAQVTPSKPATDSVKNSFNLREKQNLGLRNNANPFLTLPSNVTREVTYDALNKRYVITERIGDKLFSPPQYLTIDQYLRLVNSEIKRENWRNLSNSEVNEVRRTGLIPPVKINSRVFEKIFGGTTIDIQPRGDAELTFLGRINKNENPLFNERQRVQSNFDFNQVIRMDVVGNIGTKMKIKMNYNTEAQFDFENQIKLDYTGGKDDIIKKIEAGNVSLPLNSTLINGTQALFGVKTQLQFGKLDVATVFSQQKSQSRELQINNGAQQNEFRISGSEYEANKHYFLARYFRDNYNRALSNPPTVISGVLVTKIEVWITNKTGNTQDSRDVLAFLDLGENAPYNTAQVTGGGSVLPSAFSNPTFPAQSNNLLANLPADARQTNSNSVSSYFQANGGTDNFAKLTYARKLNEREYSFQPQLGYISLNNPLNADEVLTVAYRYTYNGVEYQVGEFSTDVTFDEAIPKVLFTKLLKNETIKTNLPTWDLMMKNIYAIGGYQISQQNFKLDIFRIDDKTGVEMPLIREGGRTSLKQYITLTNLDQLNQQKEKKPDGIFDFEAENKPFVAGADQQNNLNASSGNNYANTGANLSNLINNTSNGYVTIDPLNGRVIFPLIEPFGADLAAKFTLPAEQALADKYTYPQLYDSTKVVAQQLFNNKNLYVIKGNYQSEISSEFSLNSINVTEGSVKVFAGTIPLLEGQDFTVDYQGGRVKIINTAILISGQPIRITTENNELFGLQQRSLFGARFDYHMNKKLTLGGTFMSLSEKPLTQKVNFMEEPISNTIFGLDFNYSSSSRLLTKWIDKLPLISTKVPSSITFSGEYAQLIPGHPTAINSGGDKGGSSYLDDFEASRSIVDLKSAVPWQVSGTPQFFPESQLVDNLAYGYNRAKLAFYNIDPTFYTTGSSDLPSSLRNNKTELSNHYVREIIEQEVFPFKETSTGQSIRLPTLDLAYYPNIRGPYNYAPTGFSANGQLNNPRSRWGGISRRIDVNDFEANNIEYIEMWIMDPFMYKQSAQGGDLYFNIGNISEDLLKDGRKALENGLPANGDPTKYDETNWGRVSKLQPVVQAFDNDPDARRAQDVGLDGLSNADEKTKFAALINQIKAQLNPDAALAIDNDPSSDDYTYFRGANLDNINAGILKRYQNYNGPDGNSKTSAQSQAELGLENSASTSLPDGEDINRDNNMTQSDEYFQYKISMRPSDLQVGQGFVTDKITSQVKLANGSTQNATWYQIRIPLSQYEKKIGGIQDFKSIRFMRMFMTDFADTTVLRFAKLQLVKGEWRQYNAKNESLYVIADPAISPASPDNSIVEVATVNIEENGKRTPIPYVIPPGIERERDFSNYRGDTRQNEQSLSVIIKDLKDGYGRAAFKTAINNDFRSYKRLEMYVHLEGENAQTDLNDNDLSAFLRIGTDNQDNYYEYNMPLKVTRFNTSDPYAIWPDQNKMDIELELFQKAKTARNTARTAGGLPWPINIPFTYIDGRNTIIVKGQPDMSKIRVYMLGLKNPLRDVSSPAGDDGLLKSAQAWFNELRLTEFDERGGWAATARMSAKLADFADLNVSGSKSTIGFGSLEKKVSERNRSDNTFVDISSSLELGKLLPQKSGIKIPMYVSYSKQVLTPQYDPRTPDIELKNALKAANKAQRDSILNFAQDYTTRNSLNFTNVRKERAPNDTKIHLWDIENFNVSYAQTKFAHRDFVNENSLQHTYRASLGYNYDKTPKSYLPFDKLIKSNNLKLLKDFNFTLLPKSINFRVDVDRFYAENTLRNNDPNNFIPINTTFNKNFLISRVYGIAWDLTNSLSLDFDATNYSIVDEPDGRIEGLKRDTLWQNLKSLGRTTDYNHNLNVRYNLPINKIPGFDFVNVAAVYGTNFNWQTEPLSTLRDPSINLGNTIQNSRTVQLNPSLTMDRLYNKFGFIRRSLNTPDTTRSFPDLMVGLLTSIKKIDVNFTQTKGTFLPGYMPKTKYFGIDNATGAPGLGFVFGSQRDIREMALLNGWLTTDENQNQLYINTLREDFQMTSTIEPLKDFRVVLSATKNRTLNYSTNFRYDNSISNFRNLSPTTTGDYSVSIITLGTAFKDKNGSTISTLFNQFMANRAVISARLGRQNPNSKGTSNGFADGYDQNAQDVIISSFIAAYTGKDAGTVRLNSLPKIPLPNWRITYGGLSKIAFLAERFSELSLRHTYRSTYSVNGFNSLLKYQENAGYVSSRDVSQNFLPLYQFAQVSLSEQFAPLIGIDTRLRNNLTANFEVNKTRIMALSLSNSQLAQLSENNLVFGLGYRTTKFRFPFGFFSNLKMDNNMDFKLDVAVRDNKTVIYRADVEEAEVSSGAKNITLRPSIDYVLNQRFNVKLFYDSNITKPYTSQSFKTSFSSFGFSLRVTLN
jgi:cell surface protein SprA